MCNMFVLWGAPNQSHRTIDLIRRGEERQRLRLAAEEAQVGEDMEFKDYDKPLTMVPFFK